MVISIINSHEEVSLLVPCIRILGNATMADDRGIDMMIEQKVFGPFLKILQH